MIQNIDFIYLIKIANIYDIKAIEDKNQIFEVVDISNIRRYNIKPNSVIEIIENLEKDNIRHSKSEVIEDSVGNTLQEKNENVVLSEEGRLIIENISKSSELKNIDVIYSSNYKRAYETAEYIAKANDINIIVDERFG